MDSTLIVKKNEITFCVFYLIWNCRQAEKRASERGWSTDRR